MSYKWACPHDWLIDKANGWHDEGNADELRSVLLCLAIDLSDDTLQNCFQREMAADGYFEEVDDESNS